MQKVLKEMSEKKMTAGMEQHHAVVIAHLEEQLKLRDSKVPGVGLTGFSHIRSFESVMPHNFEPTAENDVKTALYISSMAYAKDPSGAPPPDAFTLEQIHDKTSPPADPNIPDPLPGDALHGRDLAGNDVVGIHAGHPSMAELHGLMNGSHPDTVNLGNGKTAWADSAWLTAMLKVKPEELEEKLTEHATAQGQSRQLKSQIARIRIAAENLQKKMKDESINTNREHMHEAIQSELNSIRSEMDQITPVIFASKKDIRGKPLMHEQTVGDQTHMASLMSALGTETIIVKHGGADNGIDKPGAMTYHAADMEHANAAFGAKDPEKEKSFFAEKLQSAPMVVIGPSGFELKMPKPLARQADEGSN